VNCSVSQLNRSVWVGSTLARISLTPSALRAPVDETKEPEQLGLPAPRPATAAEGGCPLPLPRIHQLPRVPGIEPFTF